MAAIVAVDGKKHTDWSSHTTQALYSSNSCLLAQFKSMLAKRNKSGRHVRRSKLGQACVACNNVQRVSPCRLCLTQALAMCGITPTSTAFMHAQVYRKFMCTRIPDKGVACPHALAAQAMRHLVLEANVTQALFNACVEQKNLLLFEVFVKLYLEHVVLIEDVTDSGCKVPHKNESLAQALVEYALVALYLLYHT